MLPLTAFTVLILIALLMTVFSFFAPSYPLVQVAVLLIAIALLVGGHPLIK